MKWENKGHEFEAYAVDIADKWTGKLFIFGLGIVGKNLYAQLSAYPESIEMKFIDNDRGKIGTIYKNTEVISLEEYLLQITRV